MARRRRTHAAAQAPVATASPGKHGDAPPTPPPHILELDRDADTLARWSDLLEVDGDQNAESDEQSNPKGSANFSACSSGGAQPPNLPSSPNDGRGLCTEKGTEAGDDSDASKAGWASASRRKGECFQLGGVVHVASRDELKAGALPDSSGKGRSRAHAKQAPLQAIIEAATNVLQARVPRRHAKYRWLRDQLQSYTCETCAEFERELVDGILTALEKA